VAISNSRFNAVTHIAHKSMNCCLGHVTDIRQDLANNGRLAYIAVVCRMEKKLLHNSPDLFGRITAYVNDEELFPKNVSIETRLNKVCHLFVVDNVLNTNRT
jgi:hypothetical protein